MRGAALLAAAKAWADEHVVRPSRPDARSDLTWNHFHNLQVKMAVRAFAAGYYAAEQDAAQAKGNWVPDGDSED